MSTLLRALVCELLTFISSSGPYTKKKLRNANNVAIKSDGDSSGDGMNPLFPFQHRWSSQLLIPATANFKFFLVFKSLLRLLLRTT